MHICFLTPNAYAVDLTLSTSECDCVCLQIDFFKGIIKFSEDVWLGPSSI